MTQSPIHLIPCDLKIFECILKGDQHIAAHLNINVPNQWTEFGSPAFEYGNKKIQEDPSSSKWWTYLPIYKESNTLIGSCGFKGPPNDKGHVEIGYEVAKLYRNKGYASEMAKQLIHIATNDKEVKSIIAHTLADKNASVSILQKFNFILVEEINDPEDGLIWKWQLNL